MLAEWHCLAEGFSESAKGGFLKTTDALRNVSLPVSHGGSSDYFKSAGCLKKALVSVFSATGRRLELIPG